MGISGLLPVLKSIQVSKHLSEFAGQTLGVDAYVWLHRGVFTCATELATGKNTTKYVDYAMQRIRLLRHHHVQPYIVFDGGPLPAKKRTELERRQKRKENLARANALAAQGKHNHAREYYVKCIDVTPQMAFQFIKALRAESIPYVVAPYEADAQLAYLERVGLVDGIITEDSDLLVFGCRSVLFKLDTVASTVISVSRKDFSSVAASESDSNGVSLVGWSDVQFRGMAILSGCDYLPSISGIGLKTACALLRKWKTVENVVRVITMEGKKNVPKGYLRQFKLAEKCFLHQRVYDPVQERLVYLTDIDYEWDDEAEAYVGGDIEPSMAKAIALGDADPVTLLPMEDINPQFLPRSSLPLPLSSNSNNLNQRKGKGKAAENFTSEGILSFFGPKAKIPSTKTQSPFQAIKVKPGMVVGRESGRRSLIDVMDQDLAVKAKREDTGMHKLTQSRFFGAPPSSKAKAGPSAVCDDKENINVIVIDDDDMDTNKNVTTDFGCDIVTDAQGHVDEMDIDVEEPKGGDLVEQEDGYISPSPSCSAEIQDLSSPPHSGATPKRGRSKRMDMDDNEHGSHDFGADVLSSPPFEKTAQFPLRVSHPRSRHLSPSHGTFSQGLNNSFIGPDLRNSFGDDLTSEIDCFEDEGKDVATPASSPLTPVTPDENVAHLNGMADGSQMVDPEELEAQAAAIRSDTVAIGWRNKWALLGKEKVVGTLRRRETAVTPAGRHLAIHANVRPRPYQNTPRSAPPKAMIKSIVKPKHTHTRKNLALSERINNKPTRGNVVGKKRGDGVVFKQMAMTAPRFDSDIADEVLSRVQDRLVQFRCP